MVAKQILNSPSICRLPVLFIHAAHALIVGRGIQAHPTLASMITINNGSYSLEYIMFQ